jgi:RsiW-degrading membrane proteinase PrsW (M82 family)
MMSDMRSPTHGPAASPATVTPLARWPRVLSFGLVVWVAACALFFVSDDEILLPTIVLVGSFLVPVTTVFWLLEHRTATVLDPDRLLAAFFVAGVLGLLAAGAFETWLLPSRVFPNLWVGLIEEGAKGIALVVVARGLPHFRARDGLILGGVVGFGFAAFETSGYALTSAITPGGVSLKDLVSIEILRAVLAPLGHGLWTGLLGAAIFGAARGGRLRITGGVVLTYLLVSVLHALWDASSTLASVVTVLTQGSAEERALLRPGNVPDPSTLDATVLFGCVQWAVTIAVSVVGVTLWRRRWRASVPA